MLRAEKEENTVFTLHLKPTPRTKQSPTVGAFFIHQMHCYNSTYFILVKGLFIFVFVPF